MYIINWYDGRWSLMQGLMGTAGWLHIWNAATITDQAQCIQVFWRVLNSMDYHLKFGWILDPIMFWLLAICWGIVENSMITGSSTHNQRIERMWVYMHRSVTRLYYRLFYFLKHQCLLDHLNELHLCALAYVHLPHINRSLDVFCEGSNNHGIRTMHHICHQGSCLSVELCSYATLD